VNPAICIGLIVAGGFVALVLWCCLAMASRQDDMAEVREIPDDVPER
jgi:hypothetical protein